MNFDDPGTYHLYFGDESGSPGTIITFFPWPEAYQGTIGSGQVGITTYAVPEGSMGFWESIVYVNLILTLKRFHVSEKNISNSNDPHGLQLELVARKEGKNSEWSFGGVPADKAVKGFRWSSIIDGKTGQNDETIRRSDGLKKVRKKGDFIRFKSTSDIGNLIDVKKTIMPNGKMEREQSIISHGVRAILKIIRNGESISVTMAME